jgi:hypothetical protein
VGRLRARQQRRQLLGDVHTEQHDAARARHAELDEFRKIQFGDAMLANNDTPNLSLALSHSEGVVVQQRFDVDSSIFELSSLAAVKTGALNVSFYPLSNGSSGTAPSGRHNVSLGSSR